MDRPHRAVLKKTVAVLLSEVGFKSASQITIGTLVEILKSFLISISQSTRAYTELAGRTQPTIGDITLAFVSNGIDFDGLEEYAFRNRRIVNLLPNPKAASIEPLPRLLPLPKKYSYVRTAAFLKPETEHADLRCKAAINRRGTERAYANFLARTSTESCNLFDDGDKSYMLGLDSTLKTPVYLSALNPIDQIFDFDELEYYYQMRNAKVVESVSVPPPLSRLRSESEYIEFDVSPTRQMSEESLAAVSVRSTSSDSSLKQTIQNPYLKLIRNGSNVVV